MGTPYMSEIKIMSFNFAPKGWAQCNGQFLPINQNQALFALLGTTYGGNGQTTFALPNLRGQVPLHFGSTVALGQAGGQEAHTVIQSEMPAHTHIVQATNDNGTQAVPGVCVLGALNNAYTSTLNNLTTLTPATITTVGGSQPHQNMQPFLVLNFCIALQGVFPTQN